MKTYSRLSIAIVAFSCLLGGCKPAYHPAAVVDPSLLSKSFANADAATKSSIDEIVSNINAAHYEVALGDLQKLYEQSGLTPDQTNAVLGVNQFVQEKFAESAKKAAKPK